MNCLPIENKFLLCETIFDYSEYGLMLRDCLAEAIPESHAFILADDASLSIDVVGGRRAVPFLESGGVFNGCPENDVEAIRELERMRADGCDFIVFARPAFYWLDFYSGLRQYLCERFPCVAYRSHPGHTVCVIFDLRSSNHPAVVSPWRYVHGEELVYLQSLVPEEKLQGAFAKAAQTLSEEMGPEGIGDYLEFGVYAGTSMATMYSTLRDLNLDHVKLFGFDSFKGLPEETSLEDVDWRPGEFACDLAITQQYLYERAIDPGRVRLIDGWFRDTLRQAFVKDYGISKASIIMIDCDIYASTVEVLRFCEPLIHDQSILFFDDWHSSNLAERNQGQKRAFDEFLATQNQLSATSFASYSENSAAFHVKRRPSAAIPIIN
jgi:hypothetical protein